MEEPHLSEKAAPRSLTDLPEELLSDIVEKVSQYRCCTEPTMNSWLTAEELVERRHSGAIVTLSRLARTCRQLHRIAEPYLYIVGSTVECGYNHPVFWAIDNYLPDVAKKAIRWGSLDYGLKYLTEAIRSRCADVAKMLITREETRKTLKKFFRRERDDSWYKQNVLIAAVKFGMSDVVEALLEIDGVFPDWETPPKTHLPLSIAAMGGHIDICRALLSKGADPSSAVEYAIKGDIYSWYSGRGSPEILRLLLDQGGDPNLGLREASEGNCTMCLRMLLEHGGVNVNVTWDREHHIPWCEHKTASNMRHVTPLLLASYGCTEEKDGLDRMKLLVKFGAETNTRCPGGGMAALHCATNTEAARILLDHGAHVNITNDQGKTPLFYAYDLEHIQLLIDRGATIDDIATNGDTVLHHIVRNSRQWGTERIRFFLRLGLDKQIDTPNNEGLTPLHLALKWPVDGGLVMLLLEHGADINARDRQGRTPLMMYEAPQIPWAYSGDALPKAFFDYGPDVNATAHDGSTALIVALKWWGPFKLEGPLKERWESDDGYGSEMHDEDEGEIEDEVEDEVEDEDDYGDEVNSAYKIVKRLLQRGADPDTPLGEGGYRPLHVAASTGSLEIADLLMEHGAEIDGTDSFGRTPLMVACWWSEDHLARGLIRRGADGTKMDCHGRKVTGYCLKLHAVRDLRKWLEGVGCERTETLS